MLAYHIYPLPDGKEYFKDDLDTEEKVIKLFDACQILEAIIEADGWKFLCDRYGLETLYQLDTKSGWHESESLGDYIMDLLGDSDGFNEYWLGRLMQLYRHSCDYEHNQLLLIYADGTRVSAVFDTACETENCKELDDPDYEEYFALFFRNSETGDLFEVSYHNLPLEVWDAGIRVI